MSRIDDILFAPIQNWRKKTKEIIEYIKTTGNVLKPMSKLYPLDRPYPKGAIQLEKMMERYHIDGQDKFWLALKYKTNRSSLNRIVFDGTIVFGKYEDGNFPTIGGNSTNRSIRDVNLVPNTYTMHYVFISEDDALEHLYSC